MALFDADFLTKLEYLSLISRRVFRGSLLAQKRTMQRGGGVEFSDHREYAAGDDFRYLDWNIYARHGDLLLKRFQEEEDLHVYLFLDCSRSMGYGTPPKFDLARQVTAALAYIALADLDRISVLAYSDRIHDNFPLTRGKARILSLMQFLERLTQQGADTDLAKTATDFVHRDQRRGLAVIVSDLFDPQGFERGLDLLRHRGYEPHIVQIHDPQEADPKLLGDVELQDIESQSLRKVTITEKNLRTYQRLFAEFQQSVRKYCRTYGIGCTQTDNRVTFDELVLRMMRQAGQVS
jgi:uncharacterized protein (DUF58 family)